MDLRVLDKSNNVIYSNDMSDNNKHAICEIHFCTSYTQVVVQDEIMVDGKIKYPTHDVILPPVGSKPNWIDEIATNGDPQGEWVNASTQQP